MSYSMAMLQTDKQVEETYPSWSASDISYCSNVHAGESVAQIQRNFADFIQPVCDERGLSVMSTGLWVSAVAAQELQNQQVLARFKTALQQNQLQLTSINGFPYGNFHQEQVKDTVYLPNWSDDARLTYSKNLAAVLAACLPEEQMCGAISTLPLGYKQHWSASKQQAALAHLSELTNYLHQLKKDTGKHIVFCLEMEPDCVLESTVELVDFFVEQVQPNVPFHNHLGVCYDVCHQAVMFEDAYQALQRITAAGITIGKIQLSSALHACFQSGNSADKDSNNTRLLTLLRQFCEPKYLHQVKGQAVGGEIVSSYDLGDAIKHGNTKGVPDWRIHFHVPIHREHLVHANLKTTRSDLLRVFDFLKDNPSVHPYLEVETYSWHVLPLELRPQDDVNLISGIVKELQWVEEELQLRGLLKPSSFVRSEEVRP